MKNLLEHLIKYYEEDPNDPFNIYALATEYKKTDIDQAIQLFELNLSKFPDYVATYYHLAKCYEEIANFDKAKAIYEIGITKALQENNQNAVRELRNALNEMLFD